MFSKTYEMYNISFKAYNNKKLKNIHKQIEVAGCIWNHCIALQRRYYRLYGGYININKLKKHISKCRNKNEYWKSLNSQSVQEVIERLDLSYVRFFKKKSKRPPKFKKIKFFNSFVLKQIGWKISDNTLQIGKIKYKFSKSRHYENIKRITVKRNKLGEIFFILCCDVKPIKRKRVGNATIGLDFGLKTYLTTSDNEKIKSPDFLKQFECEIKKANKSFSKKQKGSNNRKKSLQNLQRLYISTFNKRKDFHYKLAHRLCKNNSLICVEDLNIEGMKKLFGKKISILGFSDFINILEQTSIKYDTTIQKIDRFYPSSRLCSCGVKNENLKLSDRIWTCKSCGSVHDRDLLASKNILSEGIRLYRTKCKTDVISDLG